jgi:hypothetical protein
MIFRFGVSNLVFGVGRLKKFIKVFDLQPQTPDTKLQTVLRNLYPHFTLTDEDPFTLSQTT